ncbi:AMP-binding protein [Halobellus rufus]|uniref:AMP-binding protein n=1 Tax=Halobellus rufus TaxID=1448860 RepID=UPI0006792612|nr:AMP-binding protein [Halobellus rufus]
MTADPDADQAPGSGSAPASDSASDPSAEFPPACRDPEVVAALVDRDRRTSGTALRADGPGRSYSYREFVTTSYKAGNVLRYLGVRPGDEVLVVPRGLPEPVLAFFGAAQLGAVTRFADDVDGSPPRVVVAPAAREGDFDLPPGHRLAVYGDRPESATTTHWESEVWSENPAVHPVDVEGSDPLLATGDETVTHAGALAAASDVADDGDLRPGIESVVDGPLTDADVAVSGLLAPILAGGTIVFPD